MSHIAIIGAGLAGLILAKQLQSQATVHVFEKARGPGGRMATRRAPPYQFDHGAQFFTARDPLFQAFLEPFKTAGIIQTWTARFIEWEQGKVTQQRDWNQAYPHYVGVPGMNALPKALSQDLNVQCHTQITGLEKIGKQWILWDANQNRLGLYDWVIFCIPPAQALALLPPTCAFFNKIQSIQMKPCFALMLGFEKAIPLSFDAALVRSPSLSWLSVNSNKPAREPAFTLLAQARNDWARQHFDADREWVREVMVKQVSEIIQADATQAKHQALHAWRYANLGKQSAFTHLLDPTAGLAACGDWCIEGRVEAAFLSAHHLAQDWLRNHVT